MDPIRHSTARKGGAGAPFGARTYWTGCTAGATSSDPAFVFVNKIYTNPGLGILLWPLTPSTLSCVHARTNYKGYRKNHIFSGADMRDCLCETCTYNPRARVSSLHAACLGSPKFRPFAGKPYTYLDTQLHTWPEFPVFVGDSPPAPNPMVGTIPEWFIAELCIICCTRHSASMRCFSVVCTFSCTHHTHRQ
jgi:hypothetical protein